MLGHPLLVMCSHTLKTDVTQGLYRALKCPVFNAQFSMPGGGSRVTIS